MLCRAAPMQGFRMYSELFRRRIYRPAICLGVVICAVAALMDPLSRSYVAYQSLTRSGFNFGSAVLMSMLSLYGAYSVGALLLLLRAAPVSVPRAASQPAAFTRRASAGFSRLCLHAAQAHVM